MDRAVSRERQCGDEQGQQGRREAFRLGTHDAILRERSARSVAFYAGSTRGQGRRVGLDPIPSLLRTYPSRTPPG